MVPDGWESEVFGKVVTLSRGKHDPKKSSINFPCIELEHLTQETGKIIGYADSTKLESTKNKFKAGNVLFGKLRPYLKKYAKPDFDGVCSSEIWVFLPTKKLNADYLFQFVQTDTFIAEANKSAGSKMPRADWNVISEFLFPLPPLPEQGRIAQILSTWDKAITTTEKLLANSEQQKKALMQQLLTGKKRFLEFDDDWNEYSFQELGTTYSGLSGKSKDDFKKGKPYIPYMNIFNNSKIEVINLELVNINPGEKQNRVKYGDIFFTTSSETPHEVGMVSVLLDTLDETYLNSFCFGFRLNDFKYLLPSFAQFYLRSEKIRKDISSLAQGVTRYNLSSTRLMKIKLNLPSVREQQKIATVLSTTDREIENIKQELNCLKQEKKALMQQLLTGKKRVKVAEINNA